MSSPQGVISVRRHVERADAAHVQALSTAATGWIVDAGGRRGALAASIKPISQARSFCGTAYTVRTRARDNLAPWAALAHAKAGDVLVIATEAYAEASVMGDVLIGMARNLGIVALVTDGMVRDIAGIDAVGIPVYAQGVSPNSPHKDGPGELGTAVSIGGVVVTSGDIVRGDADGIVVVPRLQSTAVIAELESVRAKEAKMDQWVREGKTTPPWLQESMAGGILHYLD